MKQIGWIYKVVFNNGFNDRETNVVVPGFGHVGCALLIVQRSWPDAKVCRLESVGPLYEELQWRTGDDGPTPLTPAGVEMVRQERATTPPVPVQHEWSYIDWANQYQCLQCRIVVNTTEDGNTLRCNLPESPNPCEEVTRHSHPADVPRDAGGYGNRLYNPSHAWAPREGGSLAGGLFCSRCGCRRHTDVKEAFQPCAHTDSFDVSPAPGFHDSHVWRYYPPNGRVMCEKCGTYRIPYDDEATEECKPSRQVQAFIAGLRQPAPRQATPINPEEDPREHD
jgi:hypothetical protein